MSGETFWCPVCRDTYQAFWREPGDEDICRSCAAEAAGQCPYEHPHPDHPCGGPHEGPGDPCRYCGLPVPTDGSPCPLCWTDLRSMPLADVRALFAQDGTFNTDPEIP